MATVEASTFAEENYTEKGDISKKWENHCKNINFYEKLEKEIHLPVHMEDERLTTRQAENLLISNNTSRKKRKKVIDSMAATIILKSYLDRKGR